MLSRFKLSTCHVSTFLRFLIRTLDKSAVEVSDKWRLWPDAGMTLAVWIITIIGLHPPGTESVCTKFHGNPFSNCLTHFSLGQSGGLALATLLPWPKIITWWKEHALNDVVKSPSKLSVNNQIYYGPVADSGLTSAQWLNNGPGRTSR